LQKIIATIRLASFVVSNTSLEENKEIEALYVWAIERLSA